MNDLDNIRKAIEYLTRLCEDIESRLTRLESRFVRIAISEGYDTFGNRKENKDGQNKQQ